MKFVTYSASGKTAHPGLLTETGILSLPFDSMLELIRAGDKGLDAVRSLPRENLLPLHEARLHAPIPRPPTLRDFYAFEQHVRTANQIRGREIPENWYKFPVFYFTNPNSVFGPDEEIPYPSYTEALDYELEIAVIIGEAGVNIQSEDAPRHIFGYTIFNDWSARDVQREEMKVALGPAKGKDFASSLGPVIATADEFATEADGKPGVYEASMVTRVNGEECSRGNFKDIYWSFGQIIARASEAAMLYPGDVIGSGTVGTGCLLELTKAQGPWLKAGDVVELEIEGIGILRNTVGKKG
jgi:fumarylacetoacetate (FAA) hydrolase